MESKKYKVTVNEKKGTCDNSLFEKMAINGDITAIKLSEIVGTVVEITGYAKCTIETQDKTFNVNYFDTAEYGLVSSGSEIFAESVENYFGEVENVRLSEIKTRQGKTYKAVPVLNATKKSEETTETKKVAEEISEDLPF